MIHNKKSKYVLLSSILLASMNLTVTSTIYGLFLLVYTTTVQSASATSNNCINIDCLQEKFKRICENGLYLDCKSETILRCIFASLGGEEQEIMQCVEDYSVCNSNDLLARSWCDYNRGSIPK
jgi:hypothetical protein